MPSQNLEKHLKSEEINHPCKETCSGWRQGFEIGRSDLDELLKAVEDLNIDLGWLEQGAGSYVTLTVKSIKNLKLVAKRMKTK